MGSYIKMILHKNELSHTPKFKERENRESGKMWGHCQERLKVTGLGESPAPCSVGGWRPGGATNTTAGTQLAVWKLNQEESPICFRSWQKSIGLSSKEHCKISVHERSKVIVLKLHFHSKHTVLTEGRFHSGRCKYMARGYLWLQPLQGPHWLWWILMKFHQEGWRRNLSSKNRMFQRPG